jgi:proteic killer suppression protein
LTRDAILVSLACVEIESIRHKALRNFAETGKARGLPGNLVGRLRNMLAYLAAIQTMEELKAPPNYGAHELTGNRAGEWSLTVTKNWRMTFRINAVFAIEDMDLEDYH